MVGSIDSGSPFAWHPDGGKIAFVRGAALRIENVATGESTRIDATPSAIAWSPDGELLATARDNGNESVIRILDMRGRIIDETAVAGHVAKVAWRFDGEILAASLTLERFRFGSSLRSQLYRWHRGTAPAAATLSEVTIMPSRAMVSEKGYFDSFSFDLSPLGDEITFTRLVEPPNFPSYQKIIVQNIESGAEKEAPVVKLVSSGTVFSSDGEHILYGDGAGAIRRFAPWAGDDLELVPTPGRTIALSPAERYLFADGRLYLDRREVATFPATCEAAFAPVGSRLLLRCGGTLFLLSGFGEQSGPKVTPAERERLLTLRKWRSEGLISNQEYQSAQKRILTP
jgi:WD40 repeat protein